MVGSQYGWLIILGLFMGTGWVADRWARSGTSASFVRRPVLIRGRRGNHFPTVTLRCSEFCRPHGYPNCWNSHSDLICWVDRCGLYVSNRFFLLRQGPYDRRLRGDGHHRRGHLIWRVPGLIFLCSDGRPIWWIHPVFHQPNHVPLPPGPTCRRVSFTLRISCVNVLLRSTHRDVLQSRLSIARAPRVPSTERKRIIHDTHYKVKTSVLIDPYRPERADLKRLLKEM